MVVVVIGEERRRETQLSSTFGGAEAQILPWRRLGLFKRRLRPSEVLPFCLLALKEEKKKTLIFQTTPCGCCFDSDLDDLRKNRPKNPTVISLSLSPWALCSALHSPTLPFPHSTRSKHKCCELPKWAPSSGPSSPPPEIAPCGSPADPRLRALFSSRCS